jgi:hypothetical protein
MRHDAFPCELKKKKHVADPWKGFAEQQKMVAFISLSADEGLV